MMATETVITMPTKAQVTEQRNDLVQSIETHEFYRILTRVRWDHNLTCKPLGLVLVAIFADQVENR